MSEIVNLKILHQYLVKDWMKEEIIFMMMLPFFIIKSDEFNTIASSFNK